MSPSQSGGGGGGGGNSHLQNNPLDAFQEPGHPRSESESSWGFQSLLCQSFFFETILEFSHHFPQNVLWASENRYNCMSCARNGFPMQRSNNTACRYCLIKLCLDIVPAGTVPWGWREALTIIINILPCSKSHTPDILYNSLTFYISDVIKAYRKASSYLCHVTS